ncbi:LOW QUALITY PROTEIN: mas-related G-protein coupled receptor member X2-like [Pteronotus mesoamericanus]|uniref:LOW QUALITY PROTEIN: mas-related G-protein coupled receptor member X2-like n=1 Tax=Pteronotus mesoamericanus TaxID=1884717 RepID=UPI0023EBC2EB|nr:LOW QUALITY PROTEIN: mas-related G-protein coupled receptor member X2-like [Pteronotus parnellii mesoamericanus]
MTRRMEERVTTADFLSKGTDVTAWGTGLTAKNGSDQAPSKCGKATLALNVLAFLIALVGLAGNAVVFWLLGFRMKRNAFSVYILNLAGADFLFLCCQIVHSLQSFIKHSCSISGSIPYFFISVSIFAYISGLSFLCAISTERCLSILWPIWYRCRRPKHMSAVMCALLWTLSLLLSVLEGSYCGFLMRNRDQTWCQTFDFIIFAWLILLCVLLSGCSLALLSRLCGSRRLQPTRLYVVILLVVLVFLLCGLPFGFKWFLCYWVEKLCSKTFSYFLTVTGFVLSGLNSSANPIIYFFVGSFRQQWQLQQTLKRVLQRALEDMAEVEKVEEAFRRKPKRVQEAVSRSDSPSSRVPSEK